MSLFNYTDNESLGQVKTVDTATVTVAVENVELLRKLQVNRLVALQSSRPGQHLIGVVHRITRDSTMEADSESDDKDELQIVVERNTVRITLIGTFIDRVGSKADVFRRTLETVPEIDANCFPIESDRLTNFMRSVSHLAGEDTHRLALGHYTLDENAEAFLNGNRFFQRHAIIVGSTGSGKSWTTARIIEQVAGLQNANAILVDVHGEYTPLKGPGLRHLRVAGPNDLTAKASLDDGVLYLPYWLLGYEDMTTMLIDRSDQNAPNQAMVLSRTVIEAKRRFLESGGHKDVLANFTIDSPVPYDVKEVLAELLRLDTEMVMGSSGREKQGEFHGRLSRFIARLENKLNDRRDWASCSRPQMRPRSSTGSREWQGC